MTDASTVPEHEPPRQQSLFEGKRVVETVVKVTGTIPHVYAKPARELRHGETLVTVAIVKVDKIAFPGEGDTAVIREQTLKVVELFELKLPDLDLRKLLADLRAQVRKDVEARYSEADKALPDPDEYDDEYDEAGAVVLQHGSGVLDANTARRLRNRAREMAEGKSATS